MDAKQMSYPGMPESWIPLEAIAIVKCLDEDGDVRCYINKTEGMTLIEMLGYLQAAVLTTGEDVAASLRSPDGEDEE